ncbi:regulator of chromosome condensation 1/beta-lactamase-inhibitor protein II [Haematococcus lacustris]
MQVACGSRHCCAVTAQGWLLAWGWDGLGALGLGCSWAGPSSSSSASAPELGGRAGEVRQPALVRGLQGLRVTQVACGSAHTMVITDSCDCYSWGWNHNGQLGLGHAQGGCSTPHLVEAITDVVQISAGARHSVMLTKTGLCFCCGYGQFGQLGQGDSEDRHEPTVVRLGRRAQGRNNLKGEGSQGARGGLGSPTNREADEPRVKEVAAGWWHTLLLVELSEEGRVGSTHTHMVVDALPRPL